jgi:hypothetical protein
MVDYYALTGSPLPQPLHGADADYSIRTLSEHERLAIEDYYFSRDTKVALDPATTAVVVANQTEKTALEQFAVLIEFALGILTVSGFEPVTTVVTFNGSKCIDALQRSYGGGADAPTFPKKVVKAAASTWLRHLFAALRRSKGGLHITADRFVRYSRTKSSRDSLVDLCICLESLLDSETEIAFRFGVCIAKVIGGPDAEETSDLLRALNDLRSKVVHGTDPTKQHNKVDPHTVKLRLAARAILTTYVLYLTEHTKDEWKKHLRTSLFK